MPGGALGDAPYPDLLDLAAQPTFSPLDRRLEDAIFCSSTELLLSALDAGSQGCGAIDSLRQERCQILAYLVEWPSVVDGQREGSL